MPFIPQGQANLNANSAPNIYVNVLNPVAPGLNTVSGNILLVLGIGTYGPVNRQVPFGSVSEGIQNFGNPQNATFDLMTAVAIAAQQGCSNFVGIRVTDGTDVAASAIILDVTSPTPVAGVTLTSLYTGTTGNTLQATVTRGSNYTSGTPTFRVTIALPNGVAEVFDNIGGSGNTLYANIVAAINTGSGTQSASSLVVATLGSATLAPALSTYTFTGGTNGNTTITASVLIGADTATPTGMYAARNSQASVGILADVTDTSTFTTQDTFGQQEGIYFMCPGPSGETLAQAITSQQSIGVFSRVVKRLIGDWCYWNDQFNNVSRRLVSPQAFVGGALAALQPQLSSLNYQLNGILDTQTTAAKRKYTQSDIASMTANRLDVLYRNNPPLTQYFCAQTGLNMSFNVLLRNDPQTRLTYFIGNNIVALLAPFIGQPSSPLIKSQVKATIIAFLQSMVDNQQIGATDGSQPYQVNVSQTVQQAAQGIVEIDVDVCNFPIIRTMLVNLRNGDITLSSN
jgi:hypothetical protein